MIYTQDNDVLLNKGCFFLLELVSDIRLQKWEVLTTIMNNSGLIGLHMLILMCVRGTLGSKNWDLLIFTQHWPETVCLIWEEKEVTHTCKLLDLWTVHGIWPTKLGTEGPQFCNNSLKFDPSQLMPLEKDLLSYWPNIYNGTSEFSLWKHEWQKHGTCASVLESLNTEVKYFSAGLRLYKEYSMSTLLSRAGINPDSKGYSLKQLWDAVKGNLGKDVDIQCTYDVKTKTWYLFEIRLCFNKALELIDCDGIKIHGESSSPIITNCPTNLDIIYPKFKTLHSSSSIHNDTVQSNVFCLKTLIELLKIVQWLQWLTL